MDEENLNIFINKGNDISFKDFYNYLYKHVGDNSDLYIELNLANFGNLHSNIKTRDQLSSTIFSIFSMLTNKKGVVILPSFTFSWGGGNGKVFDVRSKTHLGLLPNWLLEQPETSRTLDPMYSCLVWSKKEEKYSEYCNDSFGECSIFKKMHDNNVKLISFGTNQYDPTFIHYVEQYFDENIKPYPYRSIKTFHGTIESNSIYEDMNTHKVFARNMWLTDEADYSNLTRDLLKNNLLQVKDYFGAKICISDCNSVFDTIISGLSSDITYLRKT